MRRQELHPRTAVVNKTQKINSKKSRYDALVWLGNKFPQAFDNSLRIRPLKIGVMADILHYAEEAMKDGISKSKLREAVVIFTRRLDYLACLKSREMRIDLEGNVVAQVTEDEAERATVKIKKRVEKSMRNARKGSPCKGQAPTTAKSEFVKSTPHYNSYTGGSADYPYSVDRHHSYTSQTVHSPSKSAADIIVKSKPARQYDPDAVARLKEKLGLAKQADKKEKID